MVRACVSVSKSETPVLLNVYVPNNDFFHGYTSGENIIIIACLVITISIH